MQTSTLQRLACPIFDNRTQVTQLLVRVAREFGLTPYALGGQQQNGDLEMGTAPTAAKAHGPRFF